MSHKVLFLASFAPSLVMFRGELIKNLLRDGHQVHAAAPGLSGEVQESLEAWGCQTHQVNLQPTGMNPWHDIRFIAEIWKLAKRVQPDVFLAYTIKPVIYGILGASLARVPRRCALITGLGTAFTSETNGLKSLGLLIARKLYKLALSRAHVVLFQNPDDLEQFCQLRLVGRQKCGVVNGSGVDIGHYEVMPLPPEPVFLLIARLLVDKGIREYVAAAQIVKQRYPTAKFQIAGWIDQNPFAISDAELQGWQDAGTIEFLGKLKDVRPAIAGCSVYVLPSYREGTPRSVLEAMSMGRPIITTNAPGCRETVHHGGNGFLVPVKSVEDLADAMIRTIENRQILPKMGKESRKIAEEKYDVHQVNSAILSQILPVG